MIIDRSRSLPHFNERPQGIAIDTIVIHSIFVAKGERYSASQCVTVLDENQVSSHYLVARDGSITALVDDSKRAWHAGVSMMPFPDDRRTDVNNFSIGIELVGDPEEGYLDHQYEGLRTLVSELVGRHPITSIVGHDHIAPSRKSDPGPRFNWRRLMEGMPKSIRCSGIR